MGRWGGRSRFVLINRRLHRPQGQTQNPLSTEPPAVFTLLPELSPSGSSERSFSFRPGAGWSSPVGGGGERRRREQQEGEGSS